MRNVFVPGGAGFVGSHLVRRLMKDPEMKQIVVFDNRHDPSLDLKNEARLISMMDGCDTVFHLASNADISKGETDPDMDFRDGTLLTRNILEAIRKTGAKRIIYFSGSGVYGDHGTSPLIEGKTELIPVSPYGASKLASEAMISAYCAMFGIHSLIFRPANIVGPGQTHGVAFDFVKQLKDHPNYLNVLGDGCQTKSYLDIDDVLDAVMGAAKLFKSGLHVFNLTNTDWLSVSDIAEMACKIASTGYPTKITYGKEGRGWNGDVPLVNLSGVKISEWWTPELGSRQAMERAIKAML